MSTIALLEKSFLDRGWYYGEIDKPPRRFTSAIMLDRYALTNSDREQLLRLEYLLPFFIDGCLGIARQAVNPTSSCHFAWKNLTRGRSDRQVGLWIVALSRDETPVLRARPDIIRQSNGRLIVNEITLGNTGIGMEAVERVVYDEHLPIDDKLQMSLNPVCYLEAVRGLMSGRSPLVLGVLLTPWRSLYGPEQRCFVDILKAHAAQYNIRPLFGFTTETEVRDDGVYLQGEKLDVVERVFKEYQADGASEAQSRLKYDLARINAIEQSIINAYLDGRLPHLHPNLHTWLDYKETQAWLFDPRLEGFWLEHLGNPTLLQELREFFAETYVLEVDGNEVLLNGQMYPRTVITEINGQQTSTIHTLTFESAEIVSWEQDGILKESRLVGNIARQITDIQKLAERVINRASVDFARYVHIMEKSRWRNIRVQIIGANRWLLIVENNPPNLEGEWVLKFSGGDNKAAGGHSVLIPGDCASPHMWRKAAEQFLSVAKERTVVAQRFHQPEIKPTRICDNGIERVEDCRARITIWYWFNPLRKECQMGGGDVTVMPARYGHKVHGRSNAAMTPCIWEE